MDPHDAKSWDRSGLAILEGFWSTVKACRTMDYGIKKVFITGVTPLLLSDLTSGFNEQQSKSFDRDFSTICGLTRSDIQGALRAVYGDEEKVETHLKELALYANGYHFCPELAVDTVFNTQAALLYLQVSK